MTSCGSKVPERSHGVSSSKLLEVDLGVFLVVPFFAVRGFPCGEVCLKLGLRERPPSPLKHQAPFS